MEERQRRISIQLLNLASDSWLEAVGGGREGRQRERRQETESRERGQTERERKGETERREKLGGAKKEKLRRDSCQHICY